MTDVKAGDWIIIAKGRPWREIYSFAQASKVTDQNVMTEDSVHYRKRHQRHHVTVCKDQDTAKRLQELLTSLNAEADYRIVKVNDWLRAETEKLLSQST